MHPSSNPHEPPPSSSSFRIRTSSITTTSTTIITSHHHHHHPFQVPPGFTNSNLTRRQSLPTVRLSPLLTLAAYGSIIITAFSALIGLVLASYGLNAWGDVKDRFIGARATAGKRIEPGKEIVGAWSSTTLPNFERGTGRHVPRRPHPSRSSSSFDKHGGYSSKFTLPRTGYDSPNDDFRDINLATSSDELLRRKQHQTRPSIYRRTHSTDLPPRPTLSILIASLFFTLIVVTARLMVSWWMGQQAQKNPTLAFRDAQRAYEAAQEEEQEQEDFRLPSSYPSSSRKRIKNIDRFSSLSF